MKHTFDLSLPRFTYNLKNHNKINYLIHLFILPWTFNTERTTIFIFSFCIGFATKFNDSALGVLKHHYITKGIRELLIGSSRFLINVLNHLLCYRDIKESCLFLADIVETFRLE